MSKLLRVLLVDDSEDDALLAVRELRSGGYDPVFERVSTLAEIQRALTNPTWDVILWDYSLPGFDTLQTLRLLIEQGLRIPVIMLSGVVGEYRASGMIKAGAKDYLAKGDLHRLVPTVARWLPEEQAGQDTGTPDEPQDPPTWRKRMPSKRQ